MKGHATSKMRQTGMRDVVIAAGADVYLCGHQHLMAHLKRKPEEPKWTGKTGAGDGALDYAILGSSSKLEHYRTEESSQQKQVVYDKIV